MKHKIALFVAKVIWRWITGKWVDVSGFQVQEAPDPYCDRLTTQSNSISDFSTSGSIRNAKK